MTPRQGCEELIKRRTAPCPNRAKYRVIAPGWTMLMCGVHGGPWLRTEGMGGYHRPAALHRVEELKP